MEDKLIIKYINKQKEEGLSLLIDGYGDQINTIVKNNLRKLPNHQEECLNDILLSIWTNIKNFDNKKNTLKNWIEVVSKYKTIDYKRKYLNDLKLYDIDDNFNNIDGNWEFKFIVDGKKIKGETKTYDINKTINIEDEEFKAELDVKMLRISPISTKLIYSIKIVPYQFYREKNSSNSKYSHTIKYEDKSIILDI